MAKSPTYMKKLLQRAGMEDCNPCTVPMVAPVAELQPNQLAGQLVEEELFFFL
jgi:hypothetical protein